MKEYRIRPILYGSFNYFRLESKPTWWPLWSSEGVYDNSNLAQAAVEHLAIEPMVWIKQP